MTNSVTNKPSLLFVDQISPWSLLRVGLFGPKTQTIYHFEPVGGFSRGVLQAGRTLGLVRAETKPINHHIGQVRDDSGETRLFELIDSGRAICSNIRQAEFEPNPLIRSAPTEWDPNKVLLHFEKLIEQPVYTECFRIGLIKWMLNTELGASSSDCVLLIKRSLWSAYFESHAKSQGIRLISYRHPWNLQIVGKAASKLVLALKKAPQFLTRATLGKVRSGVTSTSPPATEVSPSSNGTRAAEPATIALRYWYRKLTFDPVDRSEFFWLNGLGIPYSEVLLYDYTSDKPLDPETAEQLKTLGIRLFGRAPGVPSWTPTTRSFTTFLRLSIKLGLAYARSAAYGRWIPAFYLGVLVRLAWDYAYWQDFFATNRVRVNVGTLYTKIAQVLAMDYLNGVSASYQYAISNVLYPTTAVNAGEDLQFIFSPEFEQMWQCSKTQVDTFVHTGFIYDGAFQQIHKLDRVQDARKGLQQNGARLILCFFDENSGTGWSYYAQHEDAAADYEFLLKWLLADPSLGIVFKPKNSLTLLQRIGRVSGLIDQAKQSGRCQFLTSDSLNGNIFPAEAALIADVCVGKLGTTAALEARLAGIPTVLVDPEGFRGHPFYAWCRNRIVFEDWPSLREAIEDYRSSPESHPGFGDWSPELIRFDAFQDGQASLRMGFYLRSVYDALKAGASKSEAVSKASREFSEAWGEKQVVGADRR